LKKLGMILSVILLSGVISGCSNKQTNRTNMTLISLDQRIIDAATKAVNNYPDWCISLLDPTIKYLTGISAKGAIVLHNGNDAERMVTLYFEPYDKPYVRYLDDNPATEVKEGDPTTFYAADVSQWVTIEQANVRLKPLETRTVSITVSIPQGTKLDNNWGFAIIADAGIIAQQSYTWDITTGDYIVDKFGKPILDANGDKIPDNFLEGNLDAPIMLGDYSSITKLTSSTGEKITMSKYDARSLAFRITGLEPSSNRIITLEYDATLPFREARRQTWYVSMN